MPKVRFVVFTLFAAIFFRKKFRTLVIIRKTVEITKLIEEQMTFCRSGYDFLNISCQVFYIVSDRKKNDQSLDNFYILISTLLPIHFAGDRVTKTIGKCCKILIKVLLHFDPNWPWDKETTINSPQIFGNITVICQLLFVGCRTQLCYCYFGNETKKVEEAKNNRPISNESFVPVDVRLFCGYAAVWFHQT